MVTSINTARSRAGDPRRKEAALRYYYRVKAAVFAAYGGQCACCGETESVFLQLDHMNNDGAEHRRKLGCARDSFAIYRDLTKRGFPDGFQLLCANCHQAKTVGVVCPHKR